MVIFRSDKSNVERKVTIYVEFMIQAKIQIPCRKKNYIRRPSVEFQDENLNFAPKFCDSYSFFGRNVIHSRFRNRLILNFQPMNNVHPTRNIRNFPINLKKNVAATPYSPRAKITSPSKPNNQSYLVANAIGLFLDEQHSTFDSPANIYKRQTSMYCLQGLIRHTRTEMSN